MNKDEQSSLNDNLGPLNPCFKCSTKFCKISGKRNCTKHIKFIRYCRDHDVDYKLESGMLGYEF
jgi:hypothetical protein